MNLKETKKSLFILSFALLSSSVSLGLTNQDVIKMIESKIPEETIILSINNSENDFNLEASDLIELSGLGVPSSILNAMLGGGKKSTPSLSPGNEPHSPESVFSLKGDSLVEMNYKVPQNRTKARGLGFGGVVTYAVLKGSNATTAIEDRSPKFIVSIPKNASPDTYVSLARLEPRKNKSREVVIGGGYMSYSTGIIPDRLRELKLTQLADQSLAAKNFILYEVSPASPLVPGEFALILESGQSASLGYFGAGVTNSWFDFGVK